MHLAADAGRELTRAGQGRSGDDTVVGFAICILHEGTWVTTPICYLEDLFVDPAFRGQGIARTMIKSLQTEGQTKAGRGCTGIRAVIIPPVICMMSLPRLTIMCATGSRLGPEAVRGC
jgi:GNAT superfamily N-acetyltransferase